MDDPMIGRLNDLPEGPQATGPEARARQLIWLRRMLFLLVACCVAFAVTTLWFSRISSSLSIEKADAEATSVVREHFAALERGDYRAAYEQFSARYRERMPYDVFVEMAVGHWNLLRGEATVFPQSATPNRVVVHVDFAANKGMSLSAEFTVIRTNGRWWIDNVSWRRARLPRLLET